jgi:hypothetical protein
MLHRAIQGGGPTQEPVGSLQDNPPGCDGLHPVIPDPADRNHRNHRMDLRRPPATPVLHQTTCGGFR